MVMGEMEDTACIFFQSLPYTGNKVYLPFLEHIIEGFYGSLRKYIFLILTYRGPLICILTVEYFIFYYCTFVFTSALSCET